MLLLLQFVYDVVYWLDGMYAGTKDLDGNEPDFIEVFS
jgi:hypothetical protein